MSRLISVATCARDLIIRRLCIVIRRVEWVCKTLISRRSFSDVTLVSCVDFATHDKLSEDRLGGKLGSGFSDGLRVTFRKSISILVQ